MRLEGRGYGIDRDTCQACGESGTLFRCRDCAGAGMYCARCTVIAHSALPLHFVEVRRVLLISRVSFNSILCIRNGRAFSFNDHVYQHSVCAYSLATTSIPFVPIR